jgi:peptidoglycan/xylan/chitin deacetylase (PgdA/CDA1 family)
VLRYHSVASPDVASRYLDPGLSIAPERFRAQLRTLKRGFRFVLPEEFPSLIAGKAANQAAVAITFDDGFRDNHDVALPILLEEGAVAAFYVTTAPLDGETSFWISELWRLVPRLPGGASGLSPPAPQRVPDDPAERGGLRKELTRWMSALSATERDAALDVLADRAGVARAEGLERAFLTPDRLRTMRSAGMAIGAHTRTHPHLDLLDPRWHEEELEVSRGHLEEILGEPVLDFAYPNPGGRRQRLDVARESVRRAGYRTAVTSVSGPISRQTDLLRVPRLGVYPGEQERILFSVLERHGR